MILCIETSGEICSIALAEDISKVHYLENTEKNAHSKVLIPLIDRIFKDNGISKDALKAIAISSGPGSYTGLRIGSAAAKSICMALDIPLITINTLKILALTMMNHNKQADCFIPMLDARRMEVYTAVFDKNANRVTTDIPHIISKETPNIWQNCNPVIAGSGANKAFQFLKENGTIVQVIDNLYPKAANMVHPAFEKFNKQDFTDIVNFEPNYIKPFYTTAKPTNYKLK